MNSTLTIKKTLFLALIFCTTFSASAQLECTLKMMEDGATFGVYVRPLEEINPSRHSITGTGQITILVPNGFEIQNFESVSGQWAVNTRVNAPDENPDNDYISFGFAYDEPTIRYITNEETLLFSFQNLSEMTTSLTLIDNDNDPFAELPNSVNSNPGNDLSVFDAANNKSVYRYYGNYESETLPMVSKN